MPNIFAHSAAQDMIHEISSRLAVTPSRYFKGQQILRNLPLLLTHKPYYDKQLNSKSSTFANERIAKEYDLLNRLTMPVKSIGGFML